MVGSKHLISVHYRQTNHINLKEGGAAIPSEPREGTNTCANDKLSFLFFDGCSCYQWGGGGGGGGVRLEEDGSTHLLGKGIKWPPQSCPA